jgi:hypothetical protein
MQKLLLPAIFLALALSANCLIQDVRPNPINAENPQTELKHVGLLLLDDGKLDESGYLRLPLKVFNQYALLDEQNARYKKWDNFDLIHNDFYLAVTVANYGSNGLVRVNFVDFKTGKTVEIVQKPTGEKVPQLSHTTYRYTNATTDNIIYESDELTFKVENIEFESYSLVNSRRISLISQAHDLNLNILINVSADHEGLGAVTPLDDSNARFLYDISNGNLEAEGTLKVAGQEYTINRENAAAGHSYSRGILTDSTYVLKARAQGTLENGKPFSLFLGSGFGDIETSVATADGFVVDKYTFKLNAVEAKFDEKDLTQPIKFDTLFNSKKNFKECHVTFTPTHVDTQTVEGESINVESQVVVGKFSGYVTDNRNKKYTIKDFGGSVEILKLKI